MASRTRRRAARAVDVEAAAGPAEARYEVRRMVAVEVDGHQRMVNGTNVHEFDEATLAPLVEKGYVVDLRAADARE